MIKDVKDKMILIVETIVLYDLLFLFSPFSLTTFSLSSFFLLCLSFSKAVDNLLLSQ